MAKTKEEIKAYVLSQNWGKMWIKNIELYSNRAAGVPNNLDGHLDKMFERFFHAISSWITCNSVEIYKTHQGEDYWRSIGDTYQVWYRS